MAHDKIKAQERRKKSNKKYKQEQDKLMSQLGKEERDSMYLFLSYFLNKDFYLFGEEWKPLKGFERIYEISNYGRIKGWPRNKIKTPHLHHSGYYTTSLHDNKKIQYVIYSRLIAINFINNVGDLPEVNHKNKIRIDNRHDNLEWTTSKNNTQHRILNAKETNRRCIVQLGMDGIYIKEWESITLVEESLGKKASNISTVCRYRNDYAYGYKWMYKED